MRASVIAFLAAAFVCCVGIFLPAGQLDITGNSMVAPATISLYQLGSGEDDVRAFLDGYRDSVTKRVGAKVLAKVSPHLRGRARSDADDVQDAMAQLDTIRDEDIETVTTIAAAVMWTLLALNLLGAYLIIGASPVARRGRARAVGATVTAVLAAALAIAVHLVLVRVVAETNGELGRAMFSLRAGAYVMPVAGAAALLAAVVTVLSAFRRAPGSLPGTPA